MCLEVLSSQQNLKDTSKNSLEDPFETGFRSSIKLAPQEHINGFKVDIVKKRLEKHQEMTINCDLRSFSLKKLRDSCGDFGVVVVDQPQENQEFCSLKH